MTHHVRTLRCRAVLPALLFTAGLLTAFGALSPVEARGGHGHSGHFGRGHGGGHFSHGHSFGLRFHGSFGHRSHGHFGKFHHFGHRGHHFGHGSRFGHGRHFGHSRYRYRPYYSYPYSSYAAPSYSASRAGIYRYYQPPEGSYTGDVPSSGYGEEQASESADPGVLDTRPEPGRIELTGLPEDSAVYLNSDYLTTTDDLVRGGSILLVTAGTHRIDIIRPGYERRLEAVVEVGETVVIDLED